MEKKQLNKSFVSSYKYVFVVLVYRNIEVLSEFFENFKVKESKVVVVNSYYDNVSMENCREVSLRYNADFLNVDNRGYGYGNNEGIKYAIEHYSFDFLVISNSDIYIEQFVDLKSSYKDMIVAPWIKNLKSKSQNPNLPYCLKSYYYLLGVGYSKNLSIPIFLAHVISHLSRSIFLLMSRLGSKECYNIYSPHGSFFIVGCNALRKLYPLFDDRIFLYLEELYIGQKCRVKDVKVKYVPSIKIFHHDGASSSSISSKSFELTKDSFIVLMNIFKEWKSNK